MKRIITSIILFLILVSVHGQTFKINSTSIDVGQTYTNWEIYFVLGKAELVTEGDSKNSLDSIVNFLRNNPTTTIELGYHTDRGQPKPNLILSKQRAESVKKYLVGQGIDSLRIVAIGFGSTKPIIPKEDEIKKATTRDYCEPPYPPYRGNKRLTIRITKK